MRYLPVYCDPCARASLVLELRDADFACPVCGKGARVLPGSAYGEEDLALFAKVETTVAQAQLTPGDAGVLSELLSRLKLGDEPAWDALDPRLAWLRALYDDLASPGLRKTALTMLWTVIAARDLVAARSDRPEPSPATPFASLRTMKSRSSR